MRNQTSNHPYMTGTLSGTLSSILGGSASIPSNSTMPGNTKHGIEYLTIKIKRLKIEMLLERANRILDNWKLVDQNVKSFRKLANLKNETEIYLDAINYLLNHGFESKMIMWMQMETEVNILLPQLEDLVLELSSHRNHGDPNNETPRGNARRFLLFLSSFPEGFIFNSNRVTRFASAKEFASGSDGDQCQLLEQLSSPWLEVIDRRSRDGNKVPYHFRISKNAVEKSRNWPEKISFWPRYSLADNAESRVLDHESFFHSLVFLGCRNLNLEEHDFLSLRVLSLRNVRIKNTKHLEKLVLLQYLDLKHAELGMKSCDWLKALEELVVLDLRYTNVHKIPDECLEKLGKLQHLLLGYIPSEKSHNLAGVKMNIEKMKTKNLKTLRAVRNGNLDVIASTVVDLSVTALTKDELSEFWCKADSLIKLTSLGVAVTKGTAITLKDFPKRLKDNLKRLRIDGIFSGHDELKHFKCLIDLTLISPRSSSGSAEHFAKIEKIPTLQKLICLRLYGFLDKSLKFEGKKFENMKKLVIGDMAKLETVQIEPDQFETVHTLKFYRSSRSKTGRLELNLPFNEGSSKNIYLRDTKISAPRRTNLVFYCYDMNNQCYEKASATNGVIITQQDLILIN